MGTNYNDIAGKNVERIAALSGPGPAKLIVRNRSSLTAEQVAAIRKLLERDLRGLGVISEDSAAETAATIRVTLSTNAGGGLWVAEVVYFPLETELLRVARKKGCRTLDGGGMAVFQAASAFEIFTNHSADRERMLQSFSAIPGD